MYKSNHYFLDSNAHSIFNLSKEDIHYIDENIGIHGNPMSPNKLGKRAATIIEEARDKIAKLLGAEGGENIFFTNSCTEANYLACLSIFNYYLANLQEGDFESIKINVSPYEHDSMTQSLDIIAENKRYLKLDKNGKLLDMDNCDHCVFIGVQNEIGLIAEFDKIRENTKHLFVSDLAQAVGKININLKSLSVDIATFGAHKFGGPSGVGILYLRNPKLWSQIYGAKRYMHDMAGSINVRGIYETKFAMENAIRNMDVNMYNARIFKEVLENCLMELNFQIVGRGGNRINTTTLARVPNGKGLELLCALSDYNIHVGLGSACGSMIEQQMTSAIALGYKDAKNTEFIRISQDGSYNDMDAKYICEIICKCVNTL